MAIKQSQAKLCARCHTELAPNSKKNRCPKCLIYFRSSSAKYYAGRKDRHQCTRCGTLLVDEHQYLQCDRCREKNRAEWREDIAHLKAEVMDHYGGRCACCGEARLPFLTIDHVNNDGKEHRKVMRTGGSGSNFYYKLRKQGFPGDPPLQVLCWNCNMAKQHYSGICPHLEVAVNG